MLQKETITPESQLAGFLGVQKENEHALLFLPRFAGAVKLESEPGSAPLRYPGHTFSERDTRAAFFVQAMLGSVLDPSRIRLEDATGTDSDRIDALGAGSVFLFGSRSNPLTQWALANRAPSKFFEIDFGNDWTIRTRDGKTFSTPDPSNLKQEEYCSHADYGVMARFFDPLAGMTFFILAGLGGRATEGCGQFLAENWQVLAQEYEDQDFAVVLEFSPPVDPSNYVKVAQYSQAARNKNEGQQQPGFASR
jgi:hypothetical protein